MEICIYDTKVRQDDLTRKYLGNAVANVFFYHRTVVKVSISNTNIKILLLIIVLFIVLIYCTYLFLISRLFTILQLFNRFWLIIHQ